MRGRLIIAASALALALTPGVVWAGGDDGGQASAAHSADAPGSHSAQTSASHSADAPGSHSTEPATGEHPRSGEGVPGYQLPVRRLVPTIRLPSCCRSTDS